MALDNTADPCYSNGSGGDEDGEEKTFGAFLQGLRDAEVQRKLQRQGSCGAYRRGEIRSVPFPPSAKTALRSFAPPLQLELAPLDFELVLEERRSSLLYVIRQKPENKLDYKLFKLPCQEKMVTRTGFEPMLTA